MLLSRLWRPWSAGLPALLAVHEIRFASTASDCSLRLRPLRAGAATLLAAGESRAAELVSALPVEVRDTGSGGPEQQQAAQQPQESQPPSWGLHPLLQPAVDWAECFGGECEAPHGVSRADPLSRACPPACLSNSLHTLHPLLCGAASPG